MDKQGRVELQAGWISSHPGMQNARKGVMVNIVTHMKVVYQI